MQFYNEKQKHDLNTEAQRTQRNTKKELIKYFVNLRVLRASVLKF